MKFYFIYEQAFPFGFGLAAILCTSLGAVGLLTRKPLIFPFLVSFLGFLGILVPLFLLSLNHFLEAWPLDTGTMLLNGFGVVACPSLLLWFWLRYETTTIGVPVSVVQKCLAEEEPEGATPPRFFHLGGCSLCYLKAAAKYSADNTSDEEKLRTKLLERTAQRTLSGAVACLCAGSICALVASVSWCTSARCLVGF